MTLGQGHFWPQGHNLNKFGIGPLGDATLQISRLYNETHDTKGQENKIYPIVKGRDMFYRRHIAVGKSNMF